MGRKAAPLPRWLIRVGGRVVVGFSYPPACRAGNPLFDGVPIAPDCNALLADSPIFHAFDSEAAAHFVAAKIPGAVVEATLMLAGAPVPPDLVREAEAARLLEQKRVEADG